MKVLGLNLSHNASCAIIENGKLIFFIEEERLSKIKKDISIKKIIKNLKNQYFDYIVYTGFDINNGVINYYEKLLKNLLIENNINYKELILNQHHHQTHAYSSFYNSGFNEAICLVIDNGGISLNKEEIELGQEILSIFKIDTNNKLSDILKICSNEKGNFLNFKDFLLSVPTISLAGMYELFKVILNVKEPGAVMGYSCYGKKDKIINKPFIFENNYFISNSKFIYEVINENKNKEDICYAIQNQITEIILYYIDYIYKKFPNYNICLSGGLFQNCMINYEIIKKYKNIFVDPISHDGGTSIGAAQHVYFIKTNQKPEAYQNLYLGLEYDLNNLKSLLNNITSKNFNFKTEKTTLNEVASLLKDNNAIALFQGRSEIGPRALGNRSILFNPCNLSGKEKINLIKKREWFRPYAGTVLDEYKKDWFNFYNKENTDFMSYAVEVKKDKQNMIPAIVHIDGTCRIQTLKKENNKNFYDLIYEFYKLTNIPILLNTSLNLAGKPLVEDINDLLILLSNSDIEYAYFPDLNILLKKCKKIY
jgi:carbamoyltransferase